MSYERECERLITTLLNAYGVDVERVEVRLIPSAHIQVKGRSVSSSNWFKSLNTKSDAREYAQSVVDGFLDPVHSLPWPTERHDAPPL